MNVQVIKKIAVSAEKEKPEIYYTSMKYFAGITQFLAWPIAFTYFHLFFKLKITGKENLNSVSSPFIIISNHVAFYDSFVFRIVFGACTKKLPLRFMAVNQFRTLYLNLASKLFITNIVYAIFGVFVVVRGRGIDKNLEEAVRIMKNGGNVVVYPEGSIIHGDEIGPFKLGAAALAIKTSASVIPISMRVGTKGIRKEYTINIGEHINVDTSLSRKQVSDIFYNKIKSLHNNK